MSDQNTEFQTLRNSKGQKSGKFKWVFWLELTAVSFIPFMVFNSQIPMYILDGPDYPSGFLGQLAEGFARLGYIFFYTLGLPISILGIIMSRKMTRLCIETRALSIINLIVSAIEIIFVLILIIFILFELDHF